MAKVLVTGAAGFIGAYVASLLVADGHQVTGIDNFNAYYDPKLKRDRLAAKIGSGGFSIKEMDFSDRNGIRQLFEEGGFESVVHLGAQAGVRYSIDNPDAYADSNLTGFLNILEGCRHNGIRHLVYASSSSVYGANTKQPYAESDPVDHPVSLYAATKRSNELMAHAYAHLYGLPVTGLRFFTVYGPWGRPDMAPIKFVRRIMSGEAIDVYNNGDHARDFTYIDDIAAGVVKVLDAVPERGGGMDRPDHSDAPFRIFNIGNNAPVQLMDFIAAIEQALGVEAKKNFLPQQPGDVAATHADSSALMEAVGFKPDTPIEEGVRRLVEWARTYYNG